MEEIDEKIVLKPSTELIADEYDHFKETTPNIAVHTFYSDNDEDRQNVKLFIETLRLNGYEIDDENSYCLDTEDFDQSMSMVSQVSPETGGLILYFSCVSERDGMISVLKGEEIKSIPIQDVVIKFTSYTCLELKNKPKIFIFHIKTPSLVQVDGTRYGFSYDLTYDTPAEADMLIVYNKTEKVHSKNFTEILCSTIKDRGNVEDIVNLVACMEVDSSESRPLVISTLTRKFYFTLSKHRGHHFHITQHHEELQGHLADINNKLSKVNGSGKSKYSTGMSYASQPKRTTSRSSGNVSKQTESRVSYHVISAGANARQRLASERDGSVSKSSSRTRLVSLTTSDASVSNSNQRGAMQYAETRTSRLRLASKTDGNSSDKNNDDKRPKWK